MKYKKEKTIEAIKIVLNEQLIVDDSINCLFWACGPMGVSEDDPTIYILCNSEDNDKDYEEFECIDEAIEAFLKRTVLTPTVEETAIREYFINNPKLFSERKLFKYSQVAVPAGEADIQQLVERVKDVTEIQQFVDFIEGKITLIRFWRSNRSFDKIPCANTKFFNLAGGDIKIIRPREIACFCRP